MSGGGGAGRLHGASFQPRAQHMSSATDADRDGARCASPITSPSRRCSSVREARDCSRIQGVWRVGICDVGVVQRGQHRSSGLKSRPGSCPVCPGSHIRRARGATPWRESPEVEVLAKASVRREEIGQVQLRALRRRSPAIWSTCAAVIESLPASAGAAIAHASRDAVVQEAAEVIAAVHGRNKQPHRRYKPGRPAGVSATLKAATNAGRGRSTPRRATASCSAVPRATLSAYCALLYLLTRRVAPAVAR